MSTNQDHAEFAQFERLKLARFVLPAVALEVDAKAIFVVDAEVKRV
jgi:hypothetical protein